MVQGQPICLSCSLLYYTHVCIFSPTRSLFTVGDLFEQINQVYVFSFMWNLQLSPLFFLLVVHLTSRIKRR